VIRIILPFHLRNLAKVGKEVSLEVPSPVTLRGVLDELERAYPMLQGTILDHNTQDRRAYLRFFACQQDLSHKPLDDELPEPVKAGEEPLRIVGAMAGG
jgi:hypothetical protein